MTYTEKFARAEKIRDLYGSGVGKKELIGLFGVHRMTVERILAKKNLAAPPKSLEQKFWERVNKDGPVPAHVPELGPCWVWTGYVFANGYGGLAPSKLERLYAHRIAWKIYHGEESKLDVLHRCDNPVCVRDTHLFEGTDADNTADKCAKGRDDCFRRLTWDEVQAIRRFYARGFTQKDLSYRFECDPSTISLIVNFKSRRER
jgi:hypothetical protein